jgi:hypothetical protein
MAQSPMLPGLKQAVFALERVMSPIYGRRGAVQSRLLMDWEKIVGKTLARSSCPVRLVFREGCRVDGLLYVEIYHSSLATQMMFMEPIILEKIATYFGYKAVAKIRLVQKPSPKPMSATVVAAPRSVPLKPTNQKLSLLIKEIEDKEMRQSLENLLHVL